MLLCTLALNGCGGPPPVVPIDANRPRADGGPGVDAFAPPATDAALDPSIDADLDARVVPIDSPSATDDAPGRPPEEAFTSWTSSDVIDDATPRARAIAADAALVWIEGEEIRPNGTIDLTDAAPTRGRWTLYFTAASSMQAISITYEAYDEGAAWPSITTPTYTMRAPMDLSIAPDSSVFHDAYMNAGCTATSMLLDANLAPLALDASTPLYLRLNGGELAEFDVTSTGTMLQAGSGCM